MRNKSLALKNDKHIAKLLCNMSISGDLVIVHGNRDYAYIDYDVVSGGAIFFFVEKEIFLDNSFKKEDVHEIFSEFELQKLYKTYFNGQKVVLSNKYKLIDNDHEKFDLERGLKDAEFKAIEYMISK